MQQEWAWDVVRVVRVGCRVCLQQLLQDPQETDLLNDNAWPHPLSEIEEGPRRDTEIEERHRDHRGTQR